MRVTLSLISHTNVGKTTLARTLLRRDVGETRDEPHVTVVSEAHTMVEAGGHELLLWDTPGFGDTARLMGRLRDAEKPLGWFLGQVWDRVADRPLWCSQQAIRNVREDADLVLYLVDASQDPAAAGYVAMEMEILGWLGKPVVVLLNQTGTPLPPGEEDPDLGAWAEHLGPVAVVKEVIPLDAFSRCWVQEDRLLGRLGFYLPAGKREAYEMLSAAWRDSNRKVFEESAVTIGGLLGASCAAGRELERGTFIQRLGVGRSEIDRAAEVAREELAGELAAGFGETTGQLLKIHGLAGQAAQPILQLARENYGMPERVSEPAWGVIGGAAAGATGGLAADILAGGMTAFGGTILGAAGGGLGAYYLAKGFNLAAGEGNRIRWSASHFREQVRRAMLGYLAVAHFGRGRGEWRAGDAPPHWVEAVEEVVAGAGSEIDALWKDGGGGKPDVAVLADRAGELVAACLGEVLDRLYPRPPEDGRE